MSSLDDYVRGKLGNRARVSEEIYVESPAPASPVMGELGPVLWRELFLAVFTQQEFEAWSRRIPKYGCACSSFLGVWLKLNRPTFPLPFSFKWALKDAVNQKLGQRRLTLEEATEYWRSQGME
jgi:hypothetical protein